MENLLQDNIFRLKVNSKNEIKDIELKKYSFSIQVRLMKSGLITKLNELQNQIQAGKELDMSKIDWVNFGELLETAIDIIYIMLPEDIQRAKTKDELMDTIVNGEPMRFIQWLFTQFSKADNFLAEANPVKM